MARSFGLVSVLVFLSCLLLALPSAAQDAPAAASPSSLSESLSGDAKADYEAGKVLYVDGDFAGALLKFASAYGQSKDPRLLWNMAAAEKSLRHYGKAIELVERYLAEGGDKLTAQDRDDAQALKEAMAPFVGELTIKVSEPGAAIQIDGKNVGTSPLSQSLRLDMGPRKIRVTKAGFEPFEGTEEIRGNGTATLTITLQKAATDGTLVVHAGANDEIRVDGKMVGLGSHRATIPAGPHHVVVTAPGKRPYESDVLVEVGETSTVHVRLEDERPGAVSGGLPAWVWITGGVALAGLGTGAYFLFRDDSQEQEPFRGTMNPGVVQLPLRY